TNVYVASIDAIEPLMPVVTNGTRVFNIVTLNLEKRMALNLTVPALEEKPLLHAETRPQKLIEFIAGLPSAPLDAAIALHEEMLILNRQKVSADKRFNALELYREKPAQLTRTLADAYCSATLPLSREAKISAAAVESLWLELAYGYKLALIDQLGQLFY